ncbi:MAG: hypothetical protein LKK19_00585 [Bacteroidales bacterium]|jgi:tetratricopeptide (TPR) repeat protein|nr:hypothetical protein [Bacteroidales bacterium]MCI2121186.1 hypothetical protein [Bacteroidales bacterium]MCI2145026.1 hypothetical protein [Bacteroidales bacterium]
MKKNFLKVLFIAVATVSLVSCGSAKKMLELADQVKFACVPETLEVVGGVINADVTATFPEGYFNPKAILEVTPVLVYDGGEVAGTPFMYQGEKVEDNYKSVPEDGTSIKEKVSFNYVEGMEKSHLELRAKVTYKDKDYDIETPYKIADGANTTYMLVKASGEVEYLKDKYQPVIDEQKEAQVLYKINSAVVRKSELKSDDIKDYTDALAGIANDSRRTVKGTEIVSYASPDGPENFNNKLSDKRENSAEKVFSKFAKELETGEVTNKSIGEDWNGFQELVKNSNMEDKDLILRVLSMYSDPNVREREIKNMSSLYKSLANSILPQLRRSRFISSIEYRNYSDDELKDLVNNNMDVLDEEALLHAASIIKDNSQKVTIYDKAISEYNSDRAQYNKAVALMNSAKYDEAANAFVKVRDKSAEYYNAMGVLALRTKRYDDAVKYFTQSGTSAAEQNSAIVDILNGNYDSAVSKLAGTGNDNEGLAYILTNQIDKASTCYTKCTCPRSSYLKAIIAARKGDNETAKTWLGKATKMKKFAERAEKDIEFAKID